MLTYPLQEAIEMLSEKLASAQKSLSETVEDLEWIKEQVTVMEVNFARVHNVSNVAQHVGPLHYATWTFIPSCCPLYEVLKLTWLVSGTFSGVGINSKLNLAWSNLPRGTKTTQTRTRMLHTEKIKA